MVRLRFSAPLAALLVAAALTLPSCDSVEAQQGFEAEAASPPAGITPTDASGAATGPADPDDWRSAPAFPSASVGPAYPNPVPADFGGAVQVPVTFPFADTVTGTVTLVLYDPRQRFRPLALLDEVPAATFPGTSTLRFTLAELQAAFQLADARGLYRAYIRDGSGRLISYGDILIE